MHVYNEPPQGPFNFILSHHRLNCIQFLVQQPQIHQKKNMLHCCFLKAFPWTSCTLMFCQATTLRSLHAMPVFWTYMQHVSIHFFPSIWEINPLSLNLCSHGCFLPHGYPWRLNWSLQGWGGGVEVEASTSTPVWWWDCCKLLMTLPLMTFFNLLRVEWHLLPPLTIHPPPPPPPPPSPA